MFERATQRIAPVRAHADAIATGIQQAADHGDHVTASDLRAEIVTVNGTIAALEVRLVKWMIGIVLTVAGLQTAAMFAILRLLDR